MKNRKIIDSPCMITKRQSSTADFSLLRTFYPNKLKCSGNLILTHFNPVSNVYNPWKRQKTYGFQGV